MRRALHALVLALVLATPALAAPAFDAFSTSGTDGEPYNHVPVGTPRAVVACIRRPTADTITGVTYGGQALTELGSSPVVKTTGEVMAINCWFLGSSIPTGTQEVAVAGNSSPSNVFTWTLTASDDTEIVDDGFESADTIDSPRVALALGGRVSLCLLAWVSGENATTSVAALTDWTEDLKEDTGSTTQGMNRYTVVGSTDVSAGVDQSGDDIVMIALAVAEVAGGGPALTPRRTLLGVGP